MRISVLGTDKMRGGALTSDLEAKSEFRAGYN